MKKVFSVMVVLMVFSCGFYKSIDAQKLKKLKSEFIEEENYGIRKKPILNREYLIFLCWQIDVYGDSYPERIWRLLPIESRANSKGTKKIDFKQIFEDSENRIFKEYVLNPKFLDYPVIGLNKDLVLEIEKWMSDRYNENILIEFGYLNFNPHQRDEDCFVLESYLIDQYQGDIRNAKKMYWKDDKFLPAFRLPYTNELNFLRLNLKKKEKIREYKFKESDFLWRWDKHFIKVNKSKNEIAFNLRNPFKIKLKSTFELNEELIEDELLDKKIEYYKNIQYLDEAELSEKNKYGKQAFVLIGENNSDRPIIAEQMTFQKDSVSENKIYWIVYQKMLEFDNWPGK